LFCLGWKPSKQLFQFELAPVFYDPQKANQLGPWFEPLMSILQSADNQQVHLVNTSFGADFRDSGRAAEKIEMDDTTCHGWLKGKNWSADLDDQMMRLRDRPGWRRPINRIFNGIR
jgi:hypothetical protein